MGTEEVLQVYLQSDVSSHVEVWGWGGQSALAGTASICRLGIVPLSSLLATSDAAMATIAGREAELSPPRSGRQWV